MDHVAVADHRKHGFRAGGDDQRIGQRIEGGWNQPRIFRRRDFDLQRVQRQGRNRLDRVFVGGIGIAHGKTIVEARADFGDAITEGFLFAGRLDLADEHGRTLIVRGIEVDVDQLAGASSGFDHQVDAIALDNGFVRRQHVDNFCKGRRTEL